MGERKEVRPLSIEEVRRRAERMRQTEDDPEQAHFLEDILHKHFIAWVAADGPEPYRGVAAEVLKTGEFDFPRWCA